MAVLRRSVVAGSLALVAGGARAQQWPSRSIRLICPYAPGATGDIGARLYGDELGKALGQTVVVDNKGGANGAIAAVAVKRAEPDGYTLLMQYSGYHVITPSVSKQPLGWEAKDLQPVANVLSAPQVVVVREGLPVKTMAELIAFAKKEPGKVTYASSGNGSLQHVTGAMIEQQAGVQLTHVPYKGTGPALQDLLGAQVDLTFGTPPPYMQFIQSGKLRALAVSSRARSSVLPNVPTAAESGLKGFETSAWWALYAPANLPPELLARLRSETLAIVQSSVFRDKLVPLGVQPYTEQPPSLAEFQKGEIAKWGKAVRDAGVTLE